MFGFACINQENLSIFIRQLATLLKSGLPLVRSLEVIIKQQKNSGFSKVLRQITEKIRSGNPLSDAFAQHSKIFKPLYVNMIKAGEASGSLDLALARLAHLIERTIKTKKRVKAAMIYPFVVMFTAIVMVALLVIFIVPRFQNIFQQMLGAGELPQLTQWIIASSYFLKNNVGLWMILLITFISCSKLIHYLPYGRFVWDWWVLHSPPFSGLVNKANMARFACTLGTLLSSGVPLLQALQITRGLIHNTVISAALERVHDRVRDGDSVANALAQQNLFSQVVTSMIDVGEETGTLIEMLDRIAEDHEEELDSALSNLTAIIEPFMIVLLAIVVGIIVIALFLPIIGVMQKLAEG